MDAQSPQFPWGEVLIGEPVIRGVYFTKDRKPSFEEERAIQDISKLAIKKNLPLYEFISGKGFVEINPRDYIRNNE